MPMDNTNRQYQWTIPIDNTNRQYQWTILILPTPVVQYEWGNTNASCEAETSGYSEIASTSPMACQGFIPLIYYRKASTSPTARHGFIALYISPKGGVSNLFSSVLLLIVVDMIAAGSEAPSVPRPSEKSTIHHMGSTHLGVIFETLLLSLLLNYLFKLKNIFCKEYLRVLGCKTRCLAPYIYIYIYIFIYVCVDIYIYI